MKTFRILGMALFAILLCVNLVACGGSDEPEVDDESGVVTNEKKLVEMSIVWSGDESVTNTFTYDNNNRLISAKHTEFYNGKSHTNTKKYTWGSGIIIGNNISYNLIDNLIKSTDSENSGDLCNATFTYNSSKQLITCKDVQDYGTYITTLFWEGNKIIKSTFDNESSIYTTAISYTNKTCKGYNPIVIYFIDDLKHLLFAHPELVGMRTNQLPSKAYAKWGDEEETTEFSYTFTNDGYIESCTVKETEVYDGEIYTETTIYTFKWQ